MVLKDREEMEENVLIFMVELSEYEIEIMIMLMIALISRQDSL